MEISEVTHKPVREIPIIDPSESLPTPEMIADGKKDFINFVSALTEGVTPEFYKNRPPNSLKLNILEPDANKVWGCFMGFSADADYWSYVLNVDEAKSMNDLLAKVTEKRVGLISKPVPSEPKTALAHFVNFTAARRIVEAYHDVFPQEAQIDTENWLKTLLTKKKLRDYPDYIGLLSGFPPMSVKLFSDKSGMPARLPGIGYFRYYDTPSENDYALKEKALYYSTGMNKLVEELRQEVKAQKL